MSAHGNNAAPYVPTVLNARFAGLLVLDSPDRSVVQLTLSGRGIENRGYQTCLHY